MDHWIEEAGEPDRLILAWQAPDGLKDRVRWAVGELTCEANSGRFRYYAGDEFRRLNAGREPDALKDAGFLGYPAFDARHAGASGDFREGVIDAFMRRLPPPMRSDFPRYLEHFRLQSASGLLPLSLLAVTEARLPSDGFSLIDPLDDRTQAQDVVFEIAGHRHNTGSREALIPGQTLKLVPEPGNAHDTNAIRIEASGALIGRVNRLQAPTFGRWLKERSVSAWLLRLNGTSEKPRAFAFVRVRPLAGRRAA